MKNHRPDDITALILDVHAVAEERVFYPALLRRGDDDAEDEALASARGLGDYAAATTSGRLDATAAETDSSERTFAVLTSSAAARESLTSRMRSDIRTPSASQIEASSSEDASF